MNMKCKERYSGVYYLFLVCLTIGCSIEVVLGFLVLKCSCDVFLPVPMLTQVSVSVLFGLFFSAPFLGAPFSVSFQWLGVFGSPMVFFDILYKKNVFS